MLVWAWCVQGGQGLPVAELSGAPCGMLGQNAQLAAAAGRFAQATLSTGPHGAYLGDPRLMQQDGGGFQGYLPALPPGFSAAGVNPFQQQAAAFETQRSALELYEMLRQGQGFQAPPPPPGQPQYFPGQMQQPPQQQQQPQHQVPQQHQAPQQLPPQQPPPPQQQPPPSAGGAASQPELLPLPVQMILQQQAILQKGNHQTSLSILQGQIQRKQLPGLIAAAQLAAAQLQQASQPPAEPASMLLDPVDVGEIPSLEFGRLEDRGGPQNPVSDWVLQQGQKYKHQESLSGQQLSGGGSQPKDEQQPRRQPAPGKGSDAHSFPGIWFERAEDTWVYWDGSVRISNKGAPLSHLLWLGK